MSEINRHIGSQIKRFRKAQGLTLQQLADLIHKSRATVSKYENGEITLDVETLYEISQILHVSTNQLMDYKPEPAPEEIMAHQTEGTSSTPWKRTFYTSLTPWKCVIPPKVSYAASPART